MWSIFHPHSNAPSGCDVRGQGGGGVMCLIKDVSCSYRFTTLCMALQGYFMSLACSTLSRNQTTCWNFVLSRRVSTLMIFLWSSAPTNDYRVMLFWSLLSIADISEGPVHREYRNVSKHSADYRVFFILWHKPNNHNAITLTIFSPMDVNKHLWT
jgi:hypothetical protein